MKLYFVIVDYGVDGIGKFESKREAVQFAKESAKRASHATIWEAQKIDEWDYIVEVKHGKN